MSEGLSKDNKNISKKQKRDVGRNAGFGVTGVIVAYKELAAFSVLSIKRKTAITACIPC